MQSVDKARELFEERYGGLHEDREALWRKLGRLDLWISREVRIQLCQGHWFPRYGYVLFAHRGDCDEDVVVIAGVPLGANPQGGLPVQPVFKLEFVGFPAAHGSLIKPSLWSPRIVTGGAHEMRMWAGRLERFLTGESLARRLGRTTTPEDRPGRGCR